MSCTRPANLESPEHLETISGLQPLGTANGIQPLDPSAPKAITLPKAWGEVDLSGLHMTQAKPVDQQVLFEQLGRKPRGVLGIAHRCRCGKPAVVATAPRLDNGSPFPTTFYLSLPILTKALSKLEAGHLMVEYNQLLEEDPDLAESFRWAHQHYLAAREVIGQFFGYQPVAQVAQVSAGGLPNRVKCLHALAGHALAAGKGVNPIGDLALDRVAARGWWDPNRCYCSN